MRKYFALFCVVALLLLVSSSVQAASVFCDFESGVNWTDSSSPNYWWQFAGPSDSLSASVQSDLAPQGSNYLDLQGSDGDNDYYVGGVGHYAQLDWSGYSAFKVCIKGDSSWGAINFELYEDDNGNWSHEAASDDVWEAGGFESGSWIPINWDGWQEVVIPFSSFVDKNPGIGNDIWDPVINADGTGGLLQINLICSAPQGGSIDWAVDDLKAVPEPASLGLFVTGLSGLLMIARKKK